jgi:hypothetical protein
MPTLLLYLPLPSGKNNVIAVSGHSTASSSSIFLVPAIEIVAAAVSATSSIVIISQVLRSEGGKSIKKNRGRSTSTPNLCTPQTSTPTTFGLCREP